MIPNEAIRRTLVAIQDAEAEGFIFTADAWRQVLEVLRSEHPVALNSKQHNRPNLRC